MCVCGCLVRVDVRNPKKGRPKGDPSKVESLGRLHVHISLRAPCGRVSCHKFRPGAGMSMLRETVMAGTIFSPKFLECSSTPEQAVCTGMGHRTMAALQVADSLRNNATWLQLVSAQRPEDIAQLRSWAKKVCVTQFTTIW